MIEWFRYLVVSRQKRTRSMAQFLRRASLRGAFALLGVLTVTALAVAAAVQRSSAPLAHTTAVSGQLTVVYAFPNAKFHPQGELPRSGLLPVGGGAFIGTTVYGGRCGCGVVYELTPSSNGYTETVIYAFGSNSGYPTGEMITDRNGDIYATASAGGSDACSYGCGVVYELVASHSTYAYRSLYEFQSGSDGAAPIGGLALDNKGALYGTTLNGGGSTQCGTVFKLTPSGSGYTEKVLHAFTGSDGCWPQGTPVLGKDGSVYGVAQIGGNGNGVVFRLTPAGSEYVDSTIHEFNGGADGSQPLAGPISDSKGDLYGTTASGGYEGKGGGGIVYELSPVGSTYVESVLHRFQCKRCDNGPWASLTAGPQGTLYGTTNGDVQGSVFALSPKGKGYAFTTLYQFAHTDAAGSDPYAPVTFDASGALYGTTGDNGDCAKCGAVFKLTT